MTPDRIITLRDPDGTITFDGDSRDRLPADTIDAVHAIDAGAAIAERCDDHLDDLDGETYDRDTADVDDAHAALARRCRTVGSPATTETTTRPLCRRGP
jgi:hypothetical protein